MKRKTVRKNSFPTFSWFFISSLGSNLPLPVVGSGIVNDCSLGYSYRSKFSLLHNRACGMAYHTFCNTHVDHVTILAPFTILPHIHKSIFILGWTEICPSSLSHDTLPSALTSANVNNLLSDTPPITCWSASQSAVHLSTPTKHVQVSGTSSSFLPKGKHIQVKSSLEDLLVNNIRCIKHMVICFGELWHIWGMSFLLYDII